MRIKKVLSLAVVLAMVLTVVPMFGITASAAEAKEVTIFTADTIESGTGHTQKSATRFKSAIGPIVKIAFDVTYGALNDTSDAGNDYIAIGQLYDNHSQELQYGNSAIALQGIGEDTVGFTNGVKAGSKETGKFTITVDQTYHVELAVNLTEQSYSGTVSGGDLQQAVTFQDAAFRMEIQSIGYVVNVVATSKKRTISNFRVYQDAADVTVTYETEAGISMGTETLQGFVGDNFSVKGNIDGKYVVCENDGTKYLAEIKDSPSINVSADTENKVTVKVAPVYKLKAENLITDGDFEDGKMPGTWKNFKSSGDSDHVSEIIPENVKISSEKYQSGSSSLNIVNVGGTGSGPNALGIFPIAGIENGKKYVFSIWANSNNSLIHDGDSGNVTFTAGLRDSADIADDADAWKIDENCGGQKNEASNDSRTPNIVLPQAGFGNTKCQEDGWGQLGWVLTATDQSKAAEVFIRWAGNQYFDNFELYELEEVKAPNKPTAELGWDEESNSFTVNFKKDDTGAVATDAIEITPATEDGAFTEAAKSVEVAGKNGVAVNTGVTNRIYKAVATAAGGLGRSAEEKASIYSLVVNEILNGNYTDTAKLSPARIAKASEVITKGGLLETLDADTTAKIINKGQDNTYTINSNATELGIGFVVVDGTIVVGSVEATPTKDEAAGDATTFDTLTVADGKITLSNSEGSAFTSEAITLSLDSVNIEFIETLIEDTEAEGADAAQDFIPEL